MTAAKIFVASHLSQELVDFLGTIPSGLRPVITPTKQASLGRMFKSCCTFPMEREFSAIPLVISRVFGVDVFVPATAIQTLNYFKLPLSSIHSFSRGFELDWPQAAPFVYAVLAVVATLVECGRAAPLRPIPGGVFTPFSTEELAAVATVIVSEPASEDQETEQPPTWLYVELVPRAVEPQITKKKQKVLANKDEDRDDPDKPVPAAAPAKAQGQEKGSSAQVQEKGSSSSSSSSKLITMTEEEFQGLLTNRKHPYETGMCDDEEEEKEHKDATTLESFFDPQVKVLFDMKLKVLTGNEFSWIGEQNTPTTLKEYKLWYPKSIQVQSVFLNFMAVAAMEEGKSRWFSIFMAAQAELQTNHQADLVNRMHFFTQGLFLALKRPGALEQSPDSLINTVYRQMSNLPAASIVANVDRQLQPVVYRQQPQPVVYSQTQPVVYSHPVEARQVVQGRGGGDRGLARNRFIATRNRRNHYYYELDARLEQLFTSALRKPTSTLRSLKRNIRKAIISQLGLVDEGVENPIATDSALLVTAYPDAFLAGSEDLVDLINFPDAEAFWRLHEVTHHCPTTCSARVVEKLFRCGWSPNFVDLPRVRRGDVYEYDKCRKSIKKEIDVLLSGKRITAVRSNVLCCISPIKIVLKSDHVEEAAKLLRYNPHHLEELGPDAINRMLVEHDLPTIKTRLVTDFRVGKFNDDLHEYPFSYSTVHDAVALSYAKVSPVYTKIDFRQFFLQIPLATEYRRYFGFCFQDSEYQFNALPFGVKNAPIVASLVSAELIRLAKDLYNISSLSYIDDILIVSEGWNQALIQKDQFLAMLRKMRFEVNMDKVIGPDNRMEYLGYMLDATVKPVTISFNKFKFMVAKRKAVEAYEQQRLSYTELASLAGTLLYMSEVLPQGWAHTLLLWNAVKGLSDADRAFNIALNPQHMKCLYWWIEQLSVENYDELPSVVTQPPPTIVELMSAIKIFSDASGTIGYGFHSEDMSIVESYKWPRSMIDVSDMLVKELFPFVVFIEKYGERFANKNILWCTDNAAAAMTQNGGAARNSEPNELIIRISNVTEHWNIGVITIWIPRELNVFADYLSKTANMF